MPVVKIFIVISLLVSQFSFITPVSAASPHIVISQVQTGGAESGTAAHEFIELFNNNAQDIEITGWCIKYASNSDASQSQLGCVEAPAPNIKVWLKAGTYMSFTSAAFEVATGHKGDITIASGIAAGGGHLRVLTNAAGQEIDKVGWGTAANPEAAASPAPAGGKVLQRLPVTPSSLQDTDNNSLDFQVGELVIHTSGVYETEVTTDVCFNLDGIQEIVPVGYIDQEGVCTMDLLPLQITEVMPNAAGVDTGKEYVEVYNPTDRVADLSRYTLYVGANNEKSYQFPAGSVIDPGQYKTFYDSEIAFTLANTTGRAALTGADGTAVFQTEPYTNAADDHAWANINGVWQYTNQPTPGAVNLLSIEVPEETPGMGNAPEPCPEGKYRNPLTNRCRYIESDASVLANCDADEYRSPETNRCRKITAAASLAPCKDGQYRSEETNRCRNIEAASAQLTPCKEGQERNPDTNRCRKAETSTVPKAGYAVQAVQDGASSFIGWWALGGIGVLALGYAGWEWRYEVASAFRRAMAMFTRR